MQTKTSVKPEIKILQSLSVNKEIEQYKMPKETGLSYRTILRTLRPMEKQGIIKLFRTLPSEKGGKEKKIYTITFLGLINVLATCPLKPKELEKIIAKHPDKLLTFKKWDLFTQANLKDFMLRNLKQGLRSNFLEASILSLFTTKSAFKSEKDWRNAIDDAILVDPIENNAYQHYGKNYLEVCRQDKELSGFITKQLAIRKEQRQKEDAMSKAWEST